MVVVEYLASAKENERGAHDDHDGHGARDAFLCLGGYLWGFRSPFRECDSRQV